MENHASAQLLSLAAAAFFGVCAGVLYDLFRAIRLRRRKNHALTHLLDGLYAAFLGFLCLEMTLRIGGGELRLYLVLGLAGGALLWYALLSEAWQPIWDWWLDTAAAFLRLLWRPVAFFLRSAQKFAAQLKKGFLFCRKYATIKTRRQSLRRGKERTAMAKKPKQPPAGSRRRKRRVSPIAMLVLAALIILVSVQIVQVYTQYRSLQAEQDALESQEASLQQENDALRADLGKKDDPAFWEQLARKFANMVKQGERIFIDPNY